MTSENDLTEPKKPSQTKPPTTLAQATEQGKWNIERLNRAYSKKGLDRPLFDFVTVGSSGKRPEEVIGALRLPVFGCDVLVDVRFTPYNQYVPTWNENNLKALSKATGLEYVHRPELGVPKEVRDEIKNGKMSDGQFYEWYDKVVLTGTQADYLKEVVKKHRPAFLCTELGPVFCHRHRIAVFLERELGLVGYDV
jgi:uncharacterized protein (DUF488 family)